MRVRERERANDRESASERDRACERERVRACERERVRACERERERVSEEERGCECKKEKEEEKEKEKEKSYHLIQTMNPTPHTWQSRSYTMRETTWVRGLCSVFSVSCFGFRV